MKMMGWPLAGDLMAFPASAAGAVNDNARSFVGDIVDDGNAHGRATCVAGVAERYTPGITSTTFVGRARRLVQRMVSNELINRPL